MRERKVEGVFIVSGYCLITKQREVMAVFKSKIEAEKYRTAIEWGVSGKDWNSIEIECWIVNERFK